MNDMVPTGGGENAKPEQLSRELFDTLNTLGEKMEGKDGELCAGEEGECSLLQEWRSREVRTTFYQRGA